MRFETLRHRHRREVYEAGFLPEWRALLDARMPHVGLLDDDERAVLEDRALALIAEKRWEAARGFEFRDEVVVLIAAQAALLVLGLAPDAYRNVGSIIVHATQIVLRGPRQIVPGLVTDQPMPIAGQADHHGPVVIVWDEVLAEARHPHTGHNVVYHEFAHKLDMLTGMVDGTPPMDTAEQAARWVAVCTAVYERVRDGGGGPALRAYAGVNPGEFFAVATEVFFDAPERLQDQEPDLYDVLRGFYRQDPAARRRRAQDRAKKSCSSSTPSGATLNTMGAVGGSTP